MRAGHSSERIGVTTKKRELAKSSDELLADLERLKRLELEKRQQPISSKAFHELAEQVTETSEEIMHGVRHQERIGEEVEPGGRIEELSRSE